MQLRQFALDKISAGRWQQSDQSDKRLRWVQRVVDIVVKEFFILRCKEGDRDNLVGHVGTAQAQLGQAFTACRRSVI